MEKLKPQVAKPLAQRHTAGKWGEGRKGHIQVSDALLLLLGYSWMLPVSEPLISKSHE